MSASAPVIEMEIPPRAEFVRTVRLVVAGISGVARFNLEQIEDLKLAAGEACYAALPGLQARQAPIRLSARVLPEGVELRVGPVLTADPSPDWPVPDSRVGLALAERVVDELSLESLEDGSWIRIFKARRHPGSAV
ncbi:MAG: ATP-binding protein [Candidatus Xenobium sp.]|nr:hypothetical protein [Burkholderiales bacterium]